MIHERGFVQTMMMPGVTILLLAAQVASLFGTSLAAITEQNLPPNVCLCVQIYNSYVRDSACGTVIDLTSPPNCYIYTGYSESCIQDGSSVQYYEVNYDGKSGWILGNNLDFTAGAECGFPDQCCCMRCDSRGTCYNTANGPSCKCMIGREGPVCQFVTNPCSAQRCQNGMCQATEDGYQCFCGVMWTGPNCQYVLSSICDSTIYSDPEGAITSPNFSGDYPNSVSCVTVVQPTGTTGITLEFDPRFDIESNYDWLKITTSCPLDTRETIYDNSGPPPAILNLYSCTSVTVQFSSDSFGTGAGFSFIYRSVCGQNLLPYETQGLISSPNYPMAYSNYIDCVWNIQLREYLNITLQFLPVFHLEESFDWVQVTQTPAGCQGLSNDIVTQYSGDISPGSVTLSSCKEVTVAFHTDSTIGSTGFGIQYSVCGPTLLVDVQGTISSPRYPNAYPANIDCVWTIQLNWSSDITLDFLDPFAIETSVFGDFVKITQLQSGCVGISNDIEYYYTGTTRPESLTLAACTKITIQFLSAGFNESYSGFKLQYRATSSLSILRNDVAGSDAGAFNHSWIEFKYGFGEFSTQYWIGLERLHTLSQSGCSVRFDLQARNGTRYYARYSTFTVGDFADNYRLTLSGFRGNIFDAMFVHNNQQFSTYNFGMQQECASFYGGGWWIKESLCIFTARLTASPSSRFEWVTGADGSPEPDIPLNAAEVRFLC